MINECIDYEQRLFLSRIPRDMELRRAQSWFVQSKKDSSIFREPVHCAQLAMFLRGLVSVVANQDSIIPLPLEYDFKRLSELKTEFQSCVEVERLREIFIKTLCRLGWYKTASLEIHKRFFQRVAAFKASYDLSCNYQNTSEIALEIVRASHQVCDLKSLPADSLLEATRQDLEALKSGLDVSIQLRDNLSATLEDLVDKEVQSMTKLSPLQISDRLAPVVPCQLPVDGVRPSLECISKRLAHIAVLHWRVWNPILYQQEWHVEDANFEPPRS